MSQRTIHTEQTQYTYDSSLWLYKFMYAFFFGFVQNDDYTYDIKPTKKVNIFPITLYTCDAFSVLNYDYNYFCGDMNKLALQNDYFSVSAASSGVFWKHTATELETGFDYFGARYYDSDLSIWLSVDTLSDILPFISPYSYCYNQPVNYKDPDGRHPIVTGLIGGVASVGINYLFAKARGENYDFKKEALGDFVAGFMVGSGAALIGGLGLSATATANYLLANTALASGLGSVINQYSSRNSTSIGETSNAMLYGLFTGKISAGMSKVATKYINSIASKKISELSNGELSRYLRIQKKYFTNQMKQRGVKVGGKEFKSELNRLLKQSADVKVSEINFWSGTIKKGADNVIDISVDQLGTVGKEKLEKIDK